MFWLVLAIPLATLVAGWHLLGVAGMATFLASSAYAQSTSHFYGGGSVGQSRTEMDPAHTTGVLLPGVNTTGVATDNTGNAFKIFGGYQINRNLAHDHLRGRRNRMFDGKAAEPGPKSALTLDQMVEAWAAGDLATLEAVGVYGAPYFRGFPEDGDNQHPIGPEYAHLTAPMYANMRKTSIYGGSNEIQHNIIAKMVLGL